VNRRQLDHVVRAAAEISGDREIVVVGSQAILAYSGDVPPVMLRSMEADVYPANDPDRAEIIEGAIGAGSIFAESFGYHADGVRPETAKLPRGWEARAIRFTPANSQAVAICPAPDDLAVAKLVSGRERDLEWLRAGIGAGLFDVATVRERLNHADVEPEHIRLADARLSAMAKA
jgi:hypothetical protein